MLRVLLFLLLVMPLSVLAQPKILVLGDSLSAGYGINYANGWVNLLEEKLRISYPDAKIINASISGETSNGALARLPQLLANESPDAMIIELGGNDGLRGWSPALLKKNIETMILSAQQQDIAVLLVQMRIPLNYGKKYTEKFEAVYTDLGAEYEITLAPFILEDFVTNPEYMQADRIHPKVNAQPLIVEKIFPEVLKTLSGFADAQPELDASLID